MLRKLGNDLKLKSYLRDAELAASPNIKLLEKIRLTLLKENKKASLAIRSVSESRGVLVIRATSRVGASELYTARETISKIAEDAGINSVRFTV